ncbi:MAG: ATP-binding protein [Gammaproteobacteria bacterium]|nr:ATP-binding protein [Gammaproteobacteria bacterium]
MTRTFDGPHEFAESGYRKTLLGLFQPGNGVLPPMLAGRETEQTAFLNTLLDRLQDQRGPARDLVLYGPRGNGKTVLVTDFKRRALDVGVGVIALTPDDINSPTALISALLLSTPTQRDKADAWSSVRAGIQDLARKQGLALDHVKAGVPGISAVLRALPAEDLAPHVTEWLTLRCQAQPLLVTVDEAHTLDAAVGRQLLNLSQKLRTDNVPFALILAGTPNLETRLSEMNASFWSRAEILPIGRLSPAATAAALAEPLKNFSVTFELAALETVVEDSQRYPYFTQLWGEALCAALVNETQEHFVTPATVAQAYTRVDARRQAYYGERYRELEARDLIEAADTVAGAFEGVEQVHKAALQSALQEALGLDTSAAAAALEQLTALGYTWQTTSANDWVEPGIPSLMTHVQERWQATVAHRAQPSALGS